MEQDRIWVLMARRLAGEITPQEQLELEQFVRTNPDIHFPIQTITELWNPETYTDDPEEPDAETEAAYMAHIERLRNAHPANSQPARRNLIPYFLTLVAILTITYLVMPRKRDRVNKPVLTSISTKSGSKTKTVLPDGSQVWVNAASHLSYDNNFGKKNRELKLEGEAFFIVAHDSSKPFVVHTTDMDLVVLGTSFNVKSYPGDQTSEAALISGSMEIVLIPRKQRKVILRPTEKLVLTSTSRSDGSKTIPGKSMDEPPFLIKNITQFKAADSLIVETSWVSNKLVFSDQSLQDVLAQMERWYGVSITIDEPVNPALRYTGLFEKENLHDALAALSIIHPFEFTISKDGLNVVVKNKVKTTPLPGLSI